MRGEEIFWRESIPLREVEKWLAVDGVTWKMGLKVVEFL